MRPKSRLPRFCVAFLPLFVTGLATSDPAPAGKKHPPLVSLAEARCSACHGAVLEGRVKHPGAEDCSQCHETSGSGTQTTVRLVAPLPDLCLGCHADLAAASAGNLATPHAPVTDGCANCHRPHSGDEPRLLESAERELCLSCHEADAVAKAHPVPLGRAGCASCHAPHGSDAKKMLAGRFVHAPFGDRSCEACHQKGRAVRTRRGNRSPQAALCFACHSDLEERFGRGTVHAPVKDGRCSVCHDPHLSSEPKLAKAKGAALCAGCHEDVVRRATAKGGHAPAAGGCTGCHDPHRSDLPRLLARSGAALCAGCHDPKGSDVRKAHLGADLAKLDCSTCHDPHGSPSPALLLARSTHAPFAEGGCSACHEGGSADRFVEGGGRALCVACHGDVEERAAGAKVRHAALDGECSLCHVPHSSSRPGLVRGRGAEACGACHDDQVAGPGEVAHGVIGPLGCEACHEPHGGEGEKLLRASGDGLCLACHDGARLKPVEGASTVKLLGRFDLPSKEAAKIRAVAVGPSGPVNHPVGGHRSSGPAPPASRVSPRIRTTFLGEMRCLTCHDPHKGKSPRLFSKGAASATESCLQCHPK